MKEQKKYPELLDLKMPDYPFPSPHLLAPDESPCMTTDSWDNFNDETARLLKNLKSEANSKRDTIE